MTPDCRWSPPSALLVLAVSAFGLSACAGVDTGVGAPVDNVATPVIGIVAGLPVVDEGEVGLPVTVVDTTGTEAYGDRIGEAVRSEGTDALAAGRVTLVGHAAPVTDGEIPAARALHLAANPHAAAYVDYGDFRLWRLEVDRVRWVGGYGHMAWISAGAWARATPDPLAADAESVLADLNDDHDKACLSLARTLGKRPDAFVATAVGIDRYGLELAVSGPGGPSRLRLGFDGPVATTEEARAAVVTMVGRARYSPTSGGRP